MQHRALEDQLKIFPYKMIPGKALVLSKFQLSRKVGTI